MSKTSVDLAKMRERVMALLSDAELARVAKAEDKAKIPPGERYIDLAHLEDGIQTAADPTKQVAHEAILKSSVTSETWHSIQKLMNA